MLEKMLHSLRIFLVCSESNIAMAMVICTQISWSYTTLSTSLIPLPEAICVAMATCNLVGKMLLQ